MIQFSHVNKIYDGSYQALNDLSFFIDKAEFVFLTGASGAGKTTVLRLIDGELSPTHGLVQRPEHIVLCPQRTDDPPERLDDFLQATDHAACRWRGILHLGDDWTDRWQHLSHGERKRAQIAVACWQDPDVLLVDEPTNHIDLEARQLLLDALRAFPGIGVIVSHDRDVLDTLCRHGQLRVAQPPAVAKVHLSRRHREEQPPRAA
jgi:ATPase subunit of ABC transporter with duplicated ATPase domains